MQNFQIFVPIIEARCEEILGLSVKCFVIKRKIDLEGLRRIRDEHSQDTKTPVTSSRGSKAVHKCPTLGAIPDFCFLEKA